MKLEAQKKRSMLGIIIDIVIIIFGIWGSYVEIYENGMIMLSYYTVESNLFISLACMLDLVYQISVFKQKERSPWIKDMKYLATCCMTITFMVVLFILAPAGGIPEYIRMFFEGPLKYQHTLCPILAVFSFFVVDAYQNDLKKNKILLSLTPTVLYAVISTSLNIAKIMYGPYAFLHVYEQSIGMSVFYVVLILGIAYAIGFFLWKISSLIRKQNGV